MSAIPPRPQAVPPVMASDTPVINVARPAVPDRPVSFSANVPGYQWLNFLGSIHIFIGLVILVVFLCIALLVAIIPFMGAPKSGEVLAAALLQAAIFAGIGVFVGGLYMAIGQMLHAFRDIARNSWKAVDMLRR